MKLFQALLLACITSTAAAQDTPPWRAIGRYDHEPIRESSGLAASRQYQGVYWTLNDSGNPADLYATELDGKLIREFHVHDGANDLNDLAFVHRFRNLLYLLSR